MSTVRVAILFTDGVGVGARDPDTNPLAHGEYLLSQFDDGSGTALPHDGRRHDVDTTFGVPGRPQSASNQTAIFTGQPAPKIVGRHVLGYPNPPLRAILDEHSVMRAAVHAGRSATFANAYPLAYLRALQLPHRGDPTVATEDVIPPKILRRLRPSASTLAMAAAAVPLRTLEDARRGAGLTPDVTGEQATRRRLDVPKRTPEESAHVFWSLAADLTLFEHYLADEAGHAQDLKAATRAISTFDAFARAVIATRPKDAQVLICSDHGNVEDLSIRSHTRNPVSILSFGDATLPPMHTVADVGRAALHILGVKS